MKELPDEILPFLRMKDFGYLCTVSADNQPHISPMFFLFDEEAIRVYLQTSRSSRKVKNMRENAQVSLTIDIRDEDPTLNRGIMVQGDSELDSIQVESPEGEELCRRFEDKYPGMEKVLCAREDRVIVEIVPERIVHWVGTRFSTSFPVEQTQN